MENNYPKVMRPRFRDYTADQLKELAENPRYQVLDNDSWDGGTVQRMHQRTYVKAVELGMTAARDAGGSVVTGSCEEPAALSVLQVSSDAEPGPA